MESVRFLAVLFMVCQASHLSVNGSRRTAGINRQRATQRGNREDNDPNSVYERNGLNEEEAAWLAATELVVRDLEPEQRPGFKGRITQKGFDFASTLAINLLMKELKKLTIPDQRHDIGPADVTVSGIKVERFPRPNSNLHPIPSPGYGLRWEATNLNPTIMADWKADIDIGLWTIEKSGSATFIGEDIHFKLDFFMGKDADGRPTTEVLNCDCDGEINLEFEGAWSDILDVGSNLFNDEVRSLVTAQICAQATKEINTQLGDNLRKLPMTHVVQEHYLLDLSLVQAPVFYSDAMEVGMQGGVYLVDDIQEPPYTPPVLPPRPEDDDRMVYVSMTDYIINSGFYATYLNNIIGYSITADMVPEEHRGYLNTTCPTGLCLGTIFTELPVLYPNSMAGVDVQATSPPHLDVLGSSFNITASGSANVFVEVDGVKQSLFIIGVNISGSFNASLEDKKIMIAVSNLDILRTSANVVNTSIGDIGSGFFFESILRVVSQEVLIPKITELGQKGLGIPKVKGIEFVNPVIVQSETPGVFIVGTDISYEAKKKRKRMFGRKRLNKWKKNKKPTNKNMKKRKMTQAQKQT